MNPAAIVAYIKGLLAKYDRAITVAFTYVYHLGLAWLVSWGLRHGFHFNTGYLGLSLLTFFGRLTLAEFAHSAQRGALQAHTEHTVKLFNMQKFLEDLSANASTEAEEKAADQPASAYL